MLLAWSLTCLSCSPCNNALAPIPILSDESPSLTLLLLFQKMIAILIDSQANYFLVHSYVLIFLALKSIYCCTALFIATNLNVEGSQGQDGFVTMETFVSPAMLETR